MTPDEHRKTALALIDEAAGLRPASPGRMDRLAEATVHALLASSAEPQAEPVVEPIVTIPAPRKSRAKTPTTPTPAAG